MFPIVYFKGNISTTESLKHIFLFTLFIRKILGISLNCLLSLLYFYGLVHSIPNYLLKTSHYFYSISCGIIIVLITFPLSYQNLLDNVSCFCFHLPPM